MLLAKTPKHCHTQQRGRVSELCMRGHIHPVQRTGSSPSLAANRARYCCIGCIPIPIAAKWPPAVGNSAPLLQTLEAANVAETEAPIDRSCLSTTPFYTLSPLLWRSGGSVSYTTGISHLRASPPRSADGVQCELLPYCEGVTRVATYAFDAKQYRLPRYWRGNPLWRSNPLITDNRCRPKGAAAVKQPSSPP